MTELPSYMAIHAEQLIENGYHIIPIIPQQKVPGNYSGGGWYPLSDWSRYCTRQPTSLEINTWKRWPGCAVGLACGEVVGIDIDVLDADIAFGLERLARDMLGDTNAVRIGQAPKRALYYRTDTPFSGRKKHPIEVYGLGSQMVIFATHPVTGNPYQWPVESLMELDVSKLPTITEAQAMAWLEEAYRRIPKEIKPNNHVDMGSPSDPRGTYDAIRDALKWIPNDNVDGSTWITMCNAIKAALGPAGIDLWIDWSKQSAKSGASGKSNTAEKRYKSARPRNISAGTIYYLAEQAGWKPDAHLILNGAVAEEMDSAPNPVASLQARLTADYLAKRGDAPGYAPPPPALVMDGLTGMLAAFVDHATDTARSPQPFLALGAAMCAVGAAAGRRYRSPTNLRTNIYVIALADSGGGKERPRELLADVFVQAKMQEYLGGSRIASSAGILSEIKNHPVVLFPLDELGHMLGINSGRNAGSHKAEILPLFTELFSKAGSQYLGTSLGDTKLNPKVVLHQPHVVLYGVTVPTTLWSAFNSGSVSDGSLARFMVFHTPNDYPDRKFAEVRPLPQELLDGLQCLAGTAMGTGNLAGMRVNKQSAEEPMEALEVPIDGAGLAILQDVSNEELELMRKHRGTSQTAIYARMTEHVIRCAMIHALSENPGNPVMGLTNIRWARSLVTHCIRHLISQIKEHVSDNEVEAKHKKIINIIRKAGGISHNLLTHATQNIPKRERADILDALIEGGSIIVSQTKPNGGGRPGKFYTVSETAE